MIHAPDSYIYLFCLFAALVYLSYFFVKFRTAPTLTNVFILITSVSASYFGFELVVNLIINDTLNLGDLEESKLVVMLGGVAVIWIAFASLFSVLQVGESRKTGSES